MRRRFSPQKGAVVGACETFRNPGLADALECMAANGFAASAVGNAIVAAQAGRGHLTDADLASYRALERKPLAARVGSMQVNLNPPPAASGVLIAYSLARLCGVKGADFARVQIDTDAARMRAGTDVSQLLDRPLRQRGTTHISVIDANGNACAVTVSNGEGNGELAGQFGFMPNNILGEEDVNPYRTANWPEDTRLASMMCPSLIETGDGGLIALGSGGSSRIRSAMLQVIARLALDGAELESAIDAPRLHVEEGHLDFEDFFDFETRRALVAAFADHRAWSDYSMFFGGVHAVALHADGRYACKGDHRRDGVAIIVE